MNDSIVWKCIDATLVLSVFAFFVYLLVAQILERRARRRWRCPVGGEVDPRITRAWLAALREKS